MCFFRLQPSKHVPMTASLQHTHVCTYASQVVEERENKCKQLSIIMGESPTAYWAATWLWDVLQFLVPGVGTLIIIELGTGHDFHVSVTYDARVRGACFDSATRLKSFTFYLSHAHVSLLLVTSVFSSSSPTSTRAASEHLRAGLPPLSLRHRSARSSVRPLLCLQLTRVRTDVHAARLLRTDARAVLHQFRTGVPPTSCLVSRAG